MADEIVQPNNNVSFDRSALHEAAAKVDASRSSSVPTDDSLESAGAASGTVDQTQNPESKNVGAQGNGADPLSNADEAKSEDTVIEPPTDETISAEGTEEIDEETGLPKNADLRSVREWGIGLNKDVAALKPIKEAVESMGGIDRLKMASNLFEAWANPNFDTAAITEALSNSSPTRYQQLLLEGFNQNQDLFLEALGLDSNQFRIAARSVLQGTPITNEDLAEAKIPYGISPAEWENMSEETKTALTQRSAAEAEQLANAKKIEAERKREKTQAAQTQWATDIDSGINEILDNLKIPTDEAGNKLRARIRGNVWAAMSSDDKVASKFYGALGHFQNHEVDFAMSSLSVLKNFAQDYATDEVEYYTKAQRLQNEIDQLKLNNTKTRIEVKGGDNKEALSTVVNGAGAQTPEQLASLFSKKSLHEAGAAVDHRQRR